jgi:pimeloyl-ACP methyl ester carboxylesterase
MSVLYPEIEPYEHGFLGIGGGQQLYWEAYGNPGGRAALYLHGGPGSGSTPSAARYFDPSVYRIVLFDQRNCGRSLPNAADMGTDLAENTTWHLVDDIENLRRHLQVTDRVLLGTSWGSTLALAYAQAHPARDTFSPVRGSLPTTSRSTAGSKRAFCCATPTVKAIPGTLVQGRLDLEPPLTTAWELSRAWPGSELVIVDNAAHSPDNDGMAHAIIDATSRFSEISSK